MKNEKMRKMKILKKWSKLTNGLLLRSKQQEQKQIVIQRSNTGAGMSLLEPRKQELLQVHPQQVLKKSNTSVSKLKYSALERWQILMQKVMNRIHTN